MDQVNHNRLEEFRQLRQEVSSNEESGGWGGGINSVRGCWDEESQEEGNKRPMIHGLGS